MNIKCIFGHAWKLESSSDKKASLKEGWAGNPGYNLIKVYKCSRCPVVRNKIINWHQVVFCSKCKKETRQRWRIWSDCSGWDTWQGQGDGHWFSICIECGHFTPEPKLAQYRRHNIT